MKGPLVGTTLRSFGRINSCYVLMCCVMIAYTCSGTYFVEYQFPAALLDTKSSRHQQHFHEVMRVASKKMKDGSMFV